MLDIVLVKDSAEGRLWSFVPVLLPPQDGRGDPLSQQTSDYCVSLLSWPNRVWNFGKTKEVTTRKVFWEEAVCSCCNHLKIQSSIAFVSLHKCHTPWRAFVPRRAHDSPSTPIYPVNCRYLYTHGPLNVSGLTKTRKTVIHLWQNDVRQLSATA